MRACVGRVGGGGAGEWMRMVLVSEVCNGEN